MSHQFGIEQHFLWVRAVAWIVHSVDLSDSTFNMKSLVFRFALPPLFIYPSLASGCCVNNAIGSTNPLMFTSL